MNCLEKASEAILECIISWWERAPDFLADACYTHTGCVHSIEHRLSVPDFVSQLWRKNLEWKAKVQG